jgi:hypothetical protein
VEAADAAGVADVGSAASGLAVWGAEEASAAEAAVLVVEAAALAVVVLRAVGKSTRHIKLFPSRHLVAIND